MVTVAGIVMCCSWCGFRASLRADVAGRSRWARRAMRYPKSKPDRAARNLEPGLLSSLKRHEGSRVSWL